MFSFYAPPTQHSTSASSVEMKVDCVTESVEEVASVDTEINASTSSAPVATTSDAGDVQSAASVPSSCTSSSNEPLAPHSTAKEIEQENIKTALHEIISEIDREMEADFNEEDQPAIEVCAADVRLFLVTLGG